MHVIEKTPSQDEAGSFFLAGPGVSARRSRQAGCLARTEGVPVYAIVESGGKQYRVEPGLIVALERIPGEVGTRVELDRVLLVAEGGTVRVGQPTLAGVKVLSEIVAQTRGAKIDVFKFKRRKKYRRKTGHRQEVTKVRIADIMTG
jgi:large subunit ribosomal protein L21